MLCLAQARRRRFPLKTSAPGADGKDGTAAWAPDARDNTDSSSPGGQRSFPHTGPGPAMRGRACSVSGGEGKLFVAGGRSPWASSAVVIRGCPLPADGGHHSLVGPFLVPRIPLLDRPPALFVGKLDSLTEEAQRLVSLCERMLVAPEALRKSLSSRRVALAKPRIFSGIGVAETRLPISPTACSSRTRRKSWQGQLPFGTSWDSSRRRRPALVSRSWRSSETTSLMLRT